MKQFLITLFGSIAIFISNAQTISTYAGSGGSGVGQGAYSGDGGQATLARLNNPRGIAVDKKGNVYIADTENNCIRKIDTSGVITTIAGTGVAGYNGDGMPATLAQLNYPTHIIIDSNNNNIFISDYLNSRIRKIDATGFISTIVGTGVAGYNGDNIQATLARIDQPCGLALDKFGNLLIADAGNNRIRKRSTTGFITTIAGNGTAGFSGDGGIPTSAKLSQPAGITLDTSGNLYIVDNINERVRKISTTNIINTIAGIGTQGYTGDGGLATSAKFSNPWGICIDALGNLYVTDLNNLRVRKIDTNGFISTVAGNGTQGFSGDGGSPTLASMTPIGTTVDLLGNIFIADVDNHRIRKITSVVLPVTIVSFYTKIVDNKIRCNWQTINEINMKEFAVEKSNDGVVYSAFGVVKANGSSNYSYVVNELSIASILPNSPIYFRLKAIDNNGSYQYSRVISLKIPKTAIHIYPNPAKDYVNIESANIKQVTLLDNTGKKIIQKNCIGNNTLIKTSQLVRGVYWVETIDMNGLFETQKLLIE